MTLKEKYAISKGRGLLRFAALFCVWAVILFSGTSLARYNSSLDGNTRVEIANFVFAVNGAALDGSGNTLAGSLSPHLISSSPQSGYFTVEINPAGTEVSFDYLLTVQTAGLPAQFKVVSCATDDTAIADDAKRSPLSAGNQVSGTIALPAGATAFSASDALTMYFFWTWASGGSEQAATIGVNVLLTQHVG